MRKKTDEELARRAPSDFQAFAELYRRHLCGVYRFTRSRTSDDATAEDLTAQVFFKALSSAHTFRGHGSYQGWLYQIAHNTLASHFRSDRVAVGMEEIAERADPSLCPSLRAVQSESRRAVWSKVADLSPAQRDVVKLRYLDELSTEEISRITSRSHGAIRVLLHRARLKLRESLEGVEV